MPFEREVEIGRIRITLKQYKGETIPLRCSEYLVRVLNFINSEKLEIMFWEAEKDKIRRLNHTQAVEELIKALKIDSKIESIIKTAGI